MKTELKTASFEEIIKNNTPSINPIIRPPDINDDPIVQITKINSNLFQRIDFAEGVIGFHGGSQRKSGVKLALWSWLSAAIDCLVLVSISCFFMITFSFLMHTQAKKIVLSVIDQPNVTSLFGGAFLFSFWVYLIFMRVFNGATIGEWTCQLRLGQPLQRLKVNYFFRVLIRTTVILLTGVVVLPLLSLLFKKDIAGEISGVKIYSLK